MPVVNPLPVGIPMHTPPATPHASSLASTPGDGSPLLPPPAPRPEQLIAALHDVMGTRTLERPVSPEAAANLVHAFDLYDHNLGEVITALDLSLDAHPEHEQEAARAVVDMVERLALGETPTSTPGSAAHAINMDVQEALRVAESEQGAPLPTASRYEVILATLGDVARAFLHNDSTSRFFRITANGVQSTVRTGLIVGACTVMRQYVGYLTERLLQSHEVGVAGRSLLGAAWMAIGASALVAGGIRDHRNHTDTTASIVSRIAMIGMTLGACILAYVTDALPLMASYGAQASSYSVARDLLQLPFPIQDNSGLDFGSTFVGAAAWSALQLPASMAMGAWAPDSGPDAALSQLTTTFASCSEAAAASLQAASGLDPAGQATALYDTVCATARTLLPVAAMLVPNLIRGAINAVPEIADDQVRQYVSRLNSPEGLRLRVVPRIPTATNVADSMLTTDAGRWSVFNTIYATTHALEKMFGHLLPKDVRGSVIRGAMASAACFIVYPPLIQVHNQRPRGEVVAADLLPQPASAPQVELTSLRRLPEATV